jgi:hypothetical protein
MLDTTPIATKITKLIAAGITGDKLVARVMREFPSLTVAELSQALLRWGGPDRWPGRAEGVAGTGARAAAIRWTSSDCSCRHAHRFS